MIPALRDHNYPGQGPLTPQQIWPQASPPTGPKWSQTSPPEQAAPAPHQHAPSTHSSPAAQHPPPHAGPSAQSPDGAQGAGGAASGPRSASIAAGPSWEETESRINRESTCAAPSSDEVASTATLESAAPLSLPKHPASRPATTTSTVLAARDALPMTHLICGSYRILDEPEAALSPKRQLSFLAVMHRLAQQGSPFVISTHSPILMAYPEAAIFLLDGDGVRRVEYEETEHYQITRDFLSCHERFLKHLVVDETDSWVLRRLTGTSSKPALL